MAVGAAYGILFLVSQEGFLAGFFGLQESRTIEAWIPLFLFTILFGLSMDYHVFLLSRIREHYDRTGDTTEAVAFGIRSTGRLITGAALIMVAVFWGFSTGSLIGYNRWALLGHGHLGGRNHRPLRDGPRIHEASGQVELVPAQLAGMGPQRAV